MNKKLLLLSACLIATTAFAQEVDKAAVAAQAAANEKAAAELQAAATGDKAWKFSGVIGLNAAATGLVNWAAGGNNNVNGVASAKLRLLYQKDAIAWDTDLGLEYGLTWIDQDYDKLQKSSDKINFTTKFGWEFASKWYLTVLGGFQSQFDLGRNYNGSADFDPIISKWLAPSYTDISVGIDWKPNDIFSVYISPVAGRLTTAYISKNMNQKAADMEGSTFGQPGEDGDLEHALKEKYAVWKYQNNEDGSITKNYDANLRAELGLSFKGSINYTYKDLKIISTLGLFTPYAWDKTELYKDADGTLWANDPTKGEWAGYRDNNRRFGNFDVDWDTSISYQFLKCLQVTLSTSVKYYNGVKIDKFDKDGVLINSTERVQFKGVLGLGIGYSF